MSAAFFQIPKTAIFNEQKAQGFLPVRSPYSDPKIYMEPPPLRGYKHAPRNIKIFSGGIGPTPGGGPRYRGRGYSTPPITIHKTPPLDRRCMTHKNPPVCKWPYAEGAGRNTKGRA